MIYRRKQLGYKLLCIGGGVFVEPSEIPNKASGQHHRFMVPFPIEQTGNSSFSSIYFSSTAKHLQKFICLQIIQLNISFHHT
jgi:hypothetical protein